MMPAPRTDAWAAARQTFADQFEKYGNGFVYRRSQKGEAIPVSPDERTKFIDEFDRNIRRVNWILFASVILVVGAIVVFSVVRGSELPEGAIVAGILVATVPCFAFNRWAWGAPARALAGRTPVAGERSSDEVKRIRFKRITYGQLAGAAIGGLALTVFGGARHSGFRWDPLWVAVGGALVLLAAVQAFRKWRFEQDNPRAYEVAAPISGESEQPDASSQTTGQFLRYIPLAVIVLGGAFIAFTSVGKQFARAPSFLPVIMLGCAGWALFTVWRGFMKGRIQPFERYFYTTYDRAMQPKRFWASMAWNGFFGCLCLWLAFELPRSTAGQRIEQLCYNNPSVSSPQEVISACNQLIEGKVPLREWTRADVFLERGVVYADLGQQQRAIADYSETIRLQPNYPEAFYDRGLAYEAIGDIPHAIRDFGAAVRLNPKDYDAYFERGLLYLNKYSPDEAISDLTRAHELKPNEPSPLANRGMAYALKNDRARAEADFAVVRRVDPTNLVLRHGEGVLDMNAGNLEAAVAEFTAALHQNPSDLWSLQTRADAYQQMGDFEKARMDREMLVQLSRKRS